MKETRIALRVTVTTLEDEVLESSQIVLHLDLSRPLDDQQATACGMREAGVVYRDALGDAWELLNGRDGRDPFSGMAQI